MRKALTALFVAALVAFSPASAQSPGFPSTMPPNTVYGRSGISAGPGQAIPFTTLNLFYNTGTPAQGWVPIGQSSSAVTWNPDLNNALAFGLSTGGTQAANATALTSATGAGPAFLPFGSYPTNLGETFTGRTWGPGQWVDVSGNSRAPWHSGISSAPAYTGSGYEGGNNGTVFNGDFSYVPFATEIFITGANTAGVPSTVYLNAPPNQIPHYTSYYTASGGQSLSVAVARTGQFVYGNDVFHAGQGDLTTYSYSMFAAGPALPSSTTFLQNQAVTALAGQLTAGFNGAFLNTGQNFLNDGGFDTAGQGWNVTSNRTNATGAKNVWWNAFRSQSQGNAPVDVGFQSVGQHEIGFDTSFAVLQGTVSFTGTGSGTNLTVSAASGGYLLNGSTIAGSGVPGGTTIVSQTSGTPGGAGVYVTSGATTSSGTSITATPPWVQAAFTAAAGQRFYLNATATDSTSLSRFPLNAGTSYIDYNSTSVGIEVVVGGAPILTHTANGPKLKPVGFAALTACASGLEGTFAAVNDSSTVVWGATITGSSTSHVLAYCDGTNWTVAGK